MESIPLRPRGARRGFKGQDDVSSYKVQSFMCIVTNSIRKRERKKYKFNVYCMFLLTQTVRLIYTPGYANS